MDDNINCYVLPQMSGTGRNIFQGGSPLQESLPLLGVQLVLIVAVTRVLYFLLKPFKQPRIVSEIMGGIVLGPSVLSRSEAFKEAVFPARGEPVLSTVATFGLMYVIFLIGVLMDPMLIVRSGKKGVIIGLSGFLLPLAVTAAGSSGAAMAEEPDVTRRFAFLFALAASLSVTSFAVLSPILSELSLLNSDLGRIAMLVGVMASSLYLEIPLPDAVSLSLFMNSKGIVELIGKSTFSVLVCSLVAITAMSVPVAGMLYHHLPLLLHARRGVPPRRRQAHVADPPPPPQAPHARGRRARHHGAPRRQPQGDGGRAVLRRRVRRPQHRERGAVQFHSRATARRIGVLRRRRQRAPGERLRVRFLPARDIKDDPADRRVDNRAIEEVKALASRSSNMHVREELVGDMNKIVQMLRGLEKAGYDLVVVGMQHRWYLVMPANGLSDRSECRELGVIGDLLASSDLTRRTRCSS
ncbi:hypothetical protein ACP70R_040336 [Stipagrostis hirtigluma subsp. patula]